VDVEVLQELVEAMVMAIDPLASSFSIFKPQFGPTPTLLGPLVGTATPAAWAAA
jgi:hypothetical protein